MATVSGSNSNDVSRPLAQDPSGTVRTTVALSNLNYFDSAQLEESDRASKEKHWASCFLNNIMSEEIYNGVANAAGTKNAERAEASIQNSDER